VEDDAIVGDEDEDEDESSEDDSGNKVLFDPESDLVLRSI
jgi:hypothetical protein